MELTIHTLKSSRNWILAYYLMVKKKWHRLKKVLIVRFERAVLWGSKTEGITEKEKEYIVYTNRVVYYVTTFLVLIVLLTMMFSSNMVLIAAYILVPFAIIFAQGLKWIKKFYLSTNLLLLIPSLAIVIFEKQYFFSRNEEGGFFLYFFLMIFVVHMTMRHSNYSISKLALLYLYPALGIMICFLGFNTDGFVFSYGRHIDKMFFFNLIAVFSMLTFFLVLQISMNVRLSRKVESKQKKIIRIIENDNLYAIKAVLVAEEKEKQRFSAELHDGVGQLLAATKANLDLLVMENTDKQSRETISNCINVLKLAMSEVRNISHNLMPAILLDYGFYGAVSQICKNSKLKSGRSIQFSYDPQLETDYVLNYETSLHLFRIIQESIGNILKHAEASNASIKISIFNEQFILSIQDDGLGFAEKYSSGNGLNNIKNRAVAIGAELSIETSGRGGTGITVVLTNMNAVRKNTYVEVQSA